MGLDSFFGGGGSAGFREPQSCPRGVGRGLGLAGWRVETRGIQGRLARLPGWFFPVSCSVSCAVTAVTSFLARLWHSESVLPTSGKDSGAASSHWGVECWRPLLFVQQKNLPQYDFSLQERGRIADLWRLPGRGAGRVALARLGKCGRRCGHRDPMRRSRPPRSFRRPWPESPR